MIELTYAPVRVVENSHLRRIGGQGYTIATPAPCSARIFDDIGFEKLAVSQDFSFERIREADADYVFVWQFNVSDEDFQSNMANPVWQQLEAFKNNRVFRVETHWLGSGPAAAHRSS